MKGKVVHVQIMKEKGKTERKAPFILKADSRE
jgi:hypothetical protein